MYDKSYLESFTIYNDILKNINNKKKIIFGPFLGESGWEVTRWCGWIRWYKKTNKDKSIAVATRESRKDLYYDSVDKIYTFKIDGDYIKYRPNMYRLDFWPQHKQDELINEIKSKFKGYYICVPPNTSNRNVFPISKKDFNFTPHPENRKIIEDILSKHVDKIPICISPRHRIDSEKPTRNWPRQYWLHLFEKLKETNRYIIFILGDSSSMITPATDDSFIILNRIKHLNISNIGLTIEALYHSILTVGQQSALPVLSNYLGTKTIMWGNEKHRHQILENPFNTRCIFFEEVSIHYNTSPTIIFETILKETKC